MRSSWCRTALCFSFATLPAAVAAPQALPFSDPRWELQGAGARIERVDGRDTFAVDTGFAYRRDLRLQDGSIEFDVQLTRRRSFVYLCFRMADDRELEEVYLRPHKSGLPDALQYAPVFQGQSGWQLYHGPGATAAAEFAPGAWTRVRLVLSGSRAALFVGASERPVLVVPRLAREPKPGYLALRGFRPPDVPGEGPIARFANVTIRPGPVAFDPAWLPAETAPPGPGVVHAWSVSPAFLPTEAGSPVLPAAPGEFRRLETAPSGLLELHRSVTLPAASRSAAAVARLHLRATSAIVRALDLGFSDRATVFLNGRPLFAGDASYSFDTPRREGLIGYDQARLWLPLSAGDNELAVVVSDSFGGWGLMGRFPDTSGFEIDPR